MLGWSTMDDSDCEFTRELAFLLEKYLQVCALYRVYLWFRLRLGLGVIKVGVKWGLVRLVLGKGLA